MTQSETETPEIDAAIPIAYDTTEMKLVQKIGDLWQVHLQAQTSMDKTRDGLKKVRTHLSRRLHQLKGVLSRPGRSGEWSSFLKSHGIPRSTADRLVRVYERTLSPEDKSCTADAIVESVEVAMRRQVMSLWPKLSRVLATPEAVNMFVTELRAKAEKSFGNGTNDICSSPDIQAAQPEGRDEHSERIPLICVTPPLSLSSVGGQAVFHELTHCSRRLDRNRELTSPNESAANQNPLFLQPIGRFASPRSKMFQARARQSVHQKAHLSFERSA